MWCVFRTFRISNNRETVVGRFETVRTDSRKTRLFRTFTIVTIVPVQVSRVVHTENVFKTEQNRARFNRLRQRQRIEQAAVADTPFSRVLSRPSAATASRSPDDRLVYTWDRNSRLNTNVITGRTITPAKRSLKCSFSAATAATAAHAASPRRHRSFQVHTVRTAV